jgi:hypothetical protein
MRKFALAFAGLLASTGLASAGTCISAPVATYEASGFSCTLDNLSFSNFVVTTIGSVTLGNFSPATNGPNGEFGLTLNYTSAATGTNVSSDVDWTYVVTAINGASITDAFANFVGTVSGTGTANLGEDLVNAMTGMTVGSISLTAPNTSQVINFSPVGAIDATKDQQNFSGTAGSALTSSLTNAFSTSAVPGPIVGAGLPGLISMLLGGGGLWWRKRKRRVA